MNLSATLIKHRMIFTIAAAFAMMLMFAPVAFGADQFGTGQARPSSLGNRPLVETVMQLINVALGLLGLIAVVIVLVGGFKWMTAGGNEEKVTEARKLLISGLVGLAIILAAYAIASFVVGQLGSATGAPSF